MHATRTTTIRQAVAGVLLAATAAPAAQAQQAAAELDEIVVTSRLEAEPLQEVPLSIRALTSAELDRAGVRDLYSIAALTPGLMIDAIAPKAFVSPQIRGISQVSRSDDENNVSIFVDGVYVSGREGLDFSMLDLERIEVVKGPQSALYGRNSYAGAINFITRKPDDRFETKLRATIGSDEKRLASASLSGPIVDGVLSGRIGVAYDAFDGTFTNEVNGDGLNGYESRSVSGSLRATPTEALELLATGYYSDDDIDAIAGQLLPGDCEPDALGRPQMICGPAPSLRSGFRNDPRAFGLKRQVGRGSLTATWRAQGLRLVSITGYNSLKTDFLSDQDQQNDGLPFPIVNAATRAPAGTVRLTALFSGNNDDRDEWSQEFRVGSDGGGPFGWLLGASYYDLKARRWAPAAIDTSPIPAGFVAAGSLAGPLRAYFIPVPPSIDSTDGLVVGAASTKQTRAWAGYGLASYEFAEAATLRGELRYTTESKRARDDLTKALATETFAFWTPRVSFDYRLRPGAMLYASAARGVKAGGFNGSAPNPAELAYGPETNWTYELGAKTSWADDRLTFNVAAFYSQLRDIQITNPSQFNPLFFVVRNAGEGRSQGFEVEANWRATDALTLYLGYSLQDAEFTRAIDSTLRIYPSFARNQDISGEPLPRSPRHLLTATANYEAPAFGEFRWYARTDARYQSDQSVTTARRLGTIPERTLVNATLGLTNAHWDLSLWAQNLFDEDAPIMASFLLNLNDFSRSPHVKMGDLRTYGLTAVYRY
jgi:iron complex outermembrane receptor protein